MAIDLDLDLRERAELCDLFEEVGPDAPTLSGSWTAADLAAHLVVRERDLVGAPGILIPAFSGVTDGRMETQTRRHGYQGLIDLIRTGPPFGPMRIPAVRRLANLIEFFVHHEDVRRANGLGRRTDRDDLDDALWATLTKMAGLMVRKARLRDVCLTLQRPDGVAHQVGSGDQGVSMVGPPSELVLELYGRRSAAEVTYEGPGPAVAKVRDADFGI